jgi:hypothetical protein
MVQFEFAVVVADAVAFVLRPANCVTVSETTCATGGCVGVGVGVAVRVGVAVGVGVEGEGVAVVAAPSVPSAPPCVVGAPPQLTIRTARSAIVLRHPTVVNLHTRSARLTPRRGRGISLCSVRA